MKQDTINLIDRYLDGELSESELNKLSSLVEEDSTLRDELQSSLEMKGLFHVAQHQQFFNLENDVIAAISNEDSEFENKVIDQIKVSRRPAYKNWFMVAVAAQILFVPMAYFLFSSSSANLSTPIAKVIESAGHSFIVRGEEKINLNVGSEVYSQDHIHVQGESHIAIQYKDGSKINFLDDSFARLSDVNGKKKVELFSGQLEADVEKQLPGKNMILTTEHSTAKVMGTSFSLTSSDVSSLLEVQEGKVEFIQQEKAVIVSENHYASAGGDTEFVVKKKGDALYRSPLITEETPGHRVPIEVDIKGATKLFLVITNGGDNNLYDHGLWLNPKLVGPAGELDLTEHPWTIAKAGFFQVTKNPRPYSKKGIVNGERFEKSIFAHATSVIAWDIPKDYKYLKTTGAIADSGIYSKNSVSSVNFEVYTDMPEAMLQKLLIRRNKF